MSQTDTPTIELADPSRPITNWLIDVLGLDPDGAAAGVMSVVVEPAVQIIFILAVAFVLLRLLRRLGRRIVARAKEDQPLGPLAAELTMGTRETVSTRRRQRLDALGAVTDSVVAVVVWLTALFTILGTTFGVNLGPLIAGAGVLGVALGFGAQDLVKDFVSGVFMLAEDQFGVGDVVDVGEATGVVERVSLRTTRLRDVTGTLWHVPNGEIRRVGNMSQEWSRALLDIGVSYGTDVDHAMGVIRGVAEELAADEDFSAAFLDTPEIWGVEDLAADGILIRLVIKTVPGEQWKVARELRRRLKIAFDEADIEIPFPQRTVWMRTEDGVAGDD